MRMSRSAAVVLGAAASVLVLSAPAWAHVTVNSPGATQGGFAKLTFRVPTEEDTPTVKVEVAFPADAPLAFASVKPYPGWTYKVTKVKAPAGLSSEGGPVNQVVSTITWTATEGGIKPGEFDEFEVSAGPLPKVDEMVFKALQTYRSGNVVRWIETGSGEVEHPAPVLHLLPATGTGHGSSPATPAATASPAATVDATAEDDDDSDALGLAGLVAGGLGLLVGAAAFVRSGRRGA